MEGSHAIQRLGGDLIHKKVSACHWACAAGVTHFFLADKAVIMNEAPVDGISLCAHHVKQQDIPVGRSSVQEAMGWPSQHLHVILKNECHLHT